MIKNINDLKRFDFTPNCKTCEYRKDLGKLEYCCSFVFELMQQERLVELKKHILEYIMFDEDLIKVEPSNVFFEEDSEWGVSITFQTNLREEKKLILREIRKALLQSPYFTNVNFIKDSLYKQDYGKPREYWDSRLDEFIKNYCEEGA